MLKRKHIKRPFRRPKLSSIFIDLPDMLKLQVLEFVGFASNDPFILDYRKKYKRIMKVVNPEYMREMLDFKLKHPPHHTLIMDNNVHIGDTYFIMPPKKIQAYTLVTNNTSDSYHLVISERYKMYIRECNEMAEYILQIRSSNTTPPPLDTTTFQNTNDKLKELYFRKPLLLCNCRRLN